MKIALYARVSTNRQMQSQSIEQQIERLQEAVAQKIPIGSWHRSTYIGTMVTRGPSSIVRAWIDCEMLPVWQPSNWFW